jgi:hypothetical protein
MKKKNITILISALSILAESTIGIGFAEKKHDKSTIGVDVSIKEFRALTLVSWAESLWEVYTDKDNINYTTYPSTPNAEKYNPDLPATAQAFRQGKLIAGGYPKDVKYLDNKADKANLKVLGVKFQFTYPGNNEVTIRPPREDKYKINRKRNYISENVVDRNEAKQTPDKRDPKATPNSYDIYGIEFPGHVRHISVWVCSRGQDYDLEGWVEDYMGNTHVIKFGHTDFVGWRPMSSQLQSVPQSVNAYPSTRTAVFKQFKLRSNPRSGGDPVVLFFDELRVLTDTFENHFDGADLDFDKDDCDNKNRIEKALKDPFRPSKDCK